MNKVDRIKEELVRRILDYSQKAGKTAPTNAHLSSKLTECENLLDFVNTLQAEEKEELEKAAKEWLAPRLDTSYSAYGETKMMELSKFNGYDMLDAIDFGATWRNEDGKV